MPNPATSPKSCRRRADQAVLDGLYELHDELGSGGFGMSIFFLYCYLLNFFLFEGKVKLATHLLTGEKVAIKIIDKKAIGYCNGGEMFDYIVKKERLEESEARHFFRQLVQAIAYVHSVGYAHRDLKPENLLLKEDLQLKVIDFGLCARPKYGLSHKLQTCCGSPAYAAPELIQSTAYFGNEADVWSMGVLLYALLCGALPFEDESMPKLYKKILMNIIDEEVTKEMAYFHGMPPANMLKLLKEWHFDYMTATYLVLLQKKERKQKFTLPNFRMNGGPALSPTIHASLERNLDRSGEDDRERNRRHLFASSDYTGLRESPLDKSYANAIELGSPSVFCRSPHQIDLIQKSLHKPPAAITKTYQSNTPATSNTGINKENQRPATLRARGQVPFVQPNRNDDFRPISVYHTPRRTPFNGIFSPVANRRPQSAERDQGGRVRPCSPVSPARSITDESSDRMPRSQIKSSRLRQRVFRSLERKADKMITLLTPRKAKNDGPTKLKCIKTMVNVSVTSSTEPDKVRLELLRVLTNQGINPVQDGWKISGCKQGPGGQTTVELEVVLIDGMEYVGVKRTRLNGDAFIYKKLCEEILRLAGL
ncbi:protein kinase domain-containing protein [Ditylenchus destructor]|uniref:non-specific serine/threonine protein kinase n=1 Tax=Ditylenchus destructor TaxID=166010 RepID=A0AAD4RCF7_9BILA|nr:protein kinase domain-containing protein [Ditylenchus destructor]